MKYSEDKLVKLNVLKIGEELMRRGLSYESLARRIGVTRRQVEFTMKMGTAYLSAANKICAALNMKMREVVIY